MNVNSVKRPAGLASLISIAALAAGCANAPTRPASAAALDCAQLRTAIADARQAKREAMEKQQDAWKAVIPFAVAARYASGRSGVAEADARLAELDSQAKRQGCPA